MHEEKISAHCYIAVVLGDVSWEWCRDLCCDVWEWRFLSCFAFEVRNVRAVYGVGALCVGNCDWAVADETLADVLFETGLRWAPDVTVQGSGGVCSLDFLTSKVLVVCGDSLKIGISGNWDFNIVMVWEIEDVETGVVFHEAKWGAVGEMH